MLWGAALGLLAGYVLYTWTRKDKPWSGRRAAHAIAVTIGVLLVFAFFGPQSRSTYKEEPRWPDISFRGY